MAEMITSKRAGRSNFRLVKGVTSPTCLFFDPAKPGSGVQTGTVPVFQTLTDTVTSYRGKRADSALSTTPQDLLQENFENNSKPKFDTGHPFYSRKESVFTSHPRAVIRGTGGAFYQGPIWVNGISDSSFKPWGNSNWSTIVFPEVDLRQGTIAMSRCEPTRSPFSLVRAITESVRDFPEIPIKALRGSRSRGEAIQNIGSEYLNMIFGVVPTIDDIYSLCKRVVNFGNLVDQYKRDVGKPVRRSYAFPQTTQEVSKTVMSSRLQDGYLILNSTDACLNFWKQPGNGVPQYKNSYSQFYTEKYWFAGAFEYYLDPLLEKLGPAGEAYGVASQILGLKASLTTIWELSPWSWLIDWFFNIKDFVSLNEKIANDSLVLRYGYLMRTSSYKLSHSISGLTPIQGGTPTNLSAEFSITEKQRVRATPYGFGLNPASFSGSQWAILAALGLTKAPKTLF